MPSRRAAPSPCRASCSRSSVRRGAITGDRAESQLPRPDAVGRALTLYLLTAQRKDEVLGARWDEIDFGSGWWTIPADRAKNGLAHRVPLSPITERILKELRLRSGGPPFVFPSRGASGRATTVQKPLDRIRERTGIGFRIHDLRRTAASHMTGMGINRVVVSKILNHADRGITAGYDRHSYDNEKRAAMMAWGERLQEVVVCHRRQAPALVTCLTDPGRPLCGESPGISGAFAVSGASSASSRSAASGVPAGFRLEEFPEIFLGTPRRFVTRV